MDAVSFDFELDEKARAKKTKLVEELLKDPHVVSFAGQHHLDAQYIADHSGTFQQWVQTKTACEACRGLSFCRFEPRGHYLDLTYDGLLTYGLKPCAYYKDERLRYAHEKNYRVMDFDHADLSIDLALLPLNNESKEYRDVVMYVMKHLLDPQCREGIYLAGPPGVGKSYLCIGVCNYFARQGSTCAFVNVPRLVSQLKRLFQDNEAMEELLAKIAKAKVVVFDDIGGESVTAWSRDDVLLPLLDERMNSHRLTYFTSNYTMAELQQRYSSLQAKKSDPVAALRLLERVKALSAEKMLKGRSRR